MSLVERALQKLQAAKVTQKQLGYEEPRMPPAALVSTRGGPPKISTFDTVDVDLHQEPTPVVPRRTLKIDKDALRGLELMPPANLERAIAAQYQHIKRPLVAAAVGRGVEPVKDAHLIMLASALPGEGKTFTSINLALSMALEKDIEVLLVDADVAKPHLSRLFGCGQEPGLMDLLIDSNVRAASTILPTDIPGLSFLPAGRRIDTPTELLASERMDAVVEEIARPGASDKRIVLFDSPPLLLSNESRALIHAIGQVVLVVRAGFTPREAVVEAIEAIGEQTPIALILNQSEMEQSNGYYGYGQYGDYGDRAEQS